MNRVARYKFGYALAVTAILVTVLLALNTLGWNGLNILMIVLVMIIPGRIQGAIYRDFFRGRRLLDQGRPEDALRAFESFLVIINDKPWMNTLIWLSWSFYTPSIRAMTLNNVGAAHHAVGKLDRAEEIWCTAVEIDPLYPIPYANLAICAASRGDRTVMEELLQKSKVLGYSGGSFDRLARAGQALLARVEG